MKRVIQQPYEISVSSNRGECLVSQRLLNGLLFNQDIEGCLSALGWRYDCTPPLSLLYPFFHYPSTRYEDRLEDSSPRGCVSNAAFRLNSPSSACIEKLAGKVKLCILLEHFNFKLRLMKSHSLVSIAYSSWQHLHKSLRNRFNCNLIIAKS